MVHLTPGGGAEDDDIGAAGLAVFGKEGAAERGPGLEEIEEVGAGDDLRHDLRVGGAAEGGDLLGVVADLLEGVAACLPVPNVGQRGGGEAAAFGADGHLNDFVGMGERHAAQEHLVYDGEHGGVDADSDGQSEDGGESEDGCVA